MLLRRLARRWRVAAWTVAAGAGLTFGATGTGVTIERLLEEARYAIRSHPASGEVVLVEIDARSIAAVDHWPWPRRYHAELVDRLHRAGAASIAFDVDFSSRSRSDDDRLFADALARAGGAVVLPTIRQAENRGAIAHVDALPTEALRAHAMAAAVGVAPDDDGAVRDMPLGLVTAGVPRPSLSAMIAERGGAAGREFPIDYAIEPATIPRLSFIDVVQGRAPAGAIRGKRILVGATAVELGDRYGTPRHGVIPGVVIQALAAETLLDGVPRRAGWLLPLATLLALALLPLKARRRPTLAAALALPPIAVFFGTVLARTAFGLNFALAPGIIAWVVVGSGVLGARVAAELHRRRTVDEQTGMPNRVALVGDLASEGELVISAGRVLDYDKLLTALGASGAAELMRRVAERIALLVEAPVYRAEDRVLAWRESVAEDQIEMRADQLRRIMLAPVEVGGRRVDVALAIGFARGEGDDAATTLAHASLAASQARTEGAGWHLYSKSERDTADRDVSLLGELDAAIGEGEITVAYQPKLHIASGAVVGVEALVRWRHPVRGFMSPDLFIPLAERSGRIAGLTLHVLERTLADLRGWDAGGIRIGAAVNISAKLLDDAEFLDAAGQAIAAGGIDPRRLTLEVTESAAMHDPAGAVRALQALKALGVAVSMDDYGTGLSTLSYLKTLPLDELKLDRSFVQFAHQNRSDAVMVRSTVDLAHELGLKVVAEGVEDEGCLDYLRSIGCDIAQGYLIGRPMPADDLLALVAAGERKAA
jgi:diguanylate cyclase